MFRHHSVPASVHTADYFQKARALRRRGAWSARTWAMLFGGALIVVLLLMGPR